jgi:hypothetical protein
MYNIRAVKQGEIDELKKKNERRGNDAFHLQHANFYRNLRSEYSEVVPNAPLPRRPGGDSRSFNMLSPAVRSITSNVYRSATRAEDDVALQTRDLVESIVSIHSGESV